MFDKIFKSQKKPEQSSSPDLSLPLNLRPGGGVNISDISLALMREDLACELHGGYYTISKIGKMMFDDVMLLKLYLVDPDGHEDWSLQISFNTVKDQVEQVSFLGVLDQIFPASRDEWAEWIDANEGHLAAPTLVAPTGVEYFRLWNGSDEHVELPEIEEYLIKESDSSKHVCKMMMFGREMPEGHFEELSATVVERGQKNYIHLEGGPVLQMSDIEIY